MLDGRAVMLNVRLNLLHPSLKLNASPASTCTRSCRRVFCVAVVAGRRGGNDRRRETGIVAHTTGANATIMKERKEPCKTKRAAPK